MNDQEYDRFLSPHFRFSEFSVSRHYPHLVTPLYQIPRVCVERIRAICEFVLEPLRFQLQAAVRITSCFRNPELNRKEGGVPSSDHLFRGDAAAVDFAIPPHLPIEIAGTIARLQIPFAYIISYIHRGFLHYSIPYLGETRRGISIVDMSK